MSCEYCKYQHLDVDEEPCVECKQAYLDKFKRMTNADYIVNMSDEELAQFLCKHFNCPPEGNCPIEEECDGSNCTEHIKKWLQEGAKIDAL